MDRWEGSSITIDVRIEPDSMMLVQRRQNDANERNLVGQRVSIVWTNCHFGSRRPWFVCRHCDRRAAILYLSGGLFACRRCLGLAYLSQQETPKSRRIRRARKLRMRLGGGESLGDPFPAKPKGMHRRTYDRLCRRYYAALNKASMDMVQDVNRITNRVR
jgi:hypothetical protein